MATPLIRGFCDPFLNKQADSCAKKFEDVPELCHCLLICGGYLFKKLLQSKLNLLKKTETVFRMSETLRLEQLLAYW